MAVISEVKCGRCDRRYSGFRSRCPYCGARRNKRGKHADETENSTAKLVIGILLLVVLIAATMVLLISSLGNTEAEAGESPGVGATDDAEPTFVDSDDDVTSVPGTSSPTVSPSESPSPSIDPNVKVSSVIITYNGGERTDVTMTVGESLNFSFKTTPEADDKVPVWDTSDNSVIVVVDGHVTAMGKGTADLIVTVDDITTTCIVRVKER